MKITTRLLKLLIVFACTVFSTAAFGQLGNYTWTGLADGTNLDTVGNYTTNGTDPAVRLPDGNDGSGIQESVIFDGRTTTNLSLTKNARFLLGFSSVTRVTSFSPCFSLRSVTFSFTLGSCERAVKSAYVAVGVVYQFDFAQSMVSCFVDSQ